MLCVGHTASGADIYIALIPNEALQDDFDADSVVHDKRPTVMSKECRRAMQAMLAYFLGQSGYSDIYVTRVHPDITSDEDLRFDTNML